MSYLLKDARPRKRASFELGRCEQRGDWAGSGVIYVVTLVSATAITSTDCIINRFIRFILLIFLFLTALRRQNGAHDVNTDGEPGSKYQGDYNLNAGQNSVYHAPNTGKHSHELGSFPNGGYAG